MTKNTRLNLRKSQILTFNAVLMALSLLFVVFPVSIGPLQLAFIPLVSIVTAARLLGLKSALFQGLFFGLVSFTMAFLRPNILSLAFYNPLVSIAPRIIIGLSAYGIGELTAKLFPRLKNIFVTALSSLFGTITNTALVLGTILVFYFQREFNMGGVTLTVNWSWLVAVISGNFVIELAAVTIITPFVVEALKKALPRLSSQRAQKKT